MHLYILPGAPTLFYQEVNQNSCILFYLPSTLHFVGDGYTSEYIIRCEKKSHLAIQNNGQMHFCLDILMRHLKEKNWKRLNYPIEDWNTSTPHAIFQNHSTYTNVCLLLNMWYHNNNCIIGCSKWIFESNFEVAFPLTKDFLNCICIGIYTDLIGEISSRNPIII